MSSIRWRYLCDLSIYSAVVVLTVSNQLGNEHRRLSRVVGGPLLMRIYTAPMHHSLGRTHPRRCLLLSSKSLSFRFRLGFKMCFLQTTTKAVTKKIFLGGVSLPSLSSRFFLTFPLASCLIYARALLEYVIFIVWVRSVNMTLPSVKFAEDKVLIFFILRTVRWYIVFKTYGSIKERT